MPPGPTPPKIGRTLHRLRTSRGLGLRELARMAEVDPAYLVRLERGEKVSPSLVTLTKLSHALGVTIADLLGGK